MTPEEFASQVRAIEGELGKVIVGQEDLVRAVVLGMLAEGHVLLEGVPGLGKTLLLRTLGEALSVEFGRVQFTPDLMPADIVGTNVLRDGGFSFHAGPVFANVVLADEVNRATPKTQSALLEAMQERRVTLGGETHPLPRPFFVMATQNPLEMEGTYPLPEAQLDRFLFKVLVPFPSADDIVEILERTTAEANPVVEKITDGARLTEMISMVREVPAASHVLRYAAALVAATHPNHDSATPKVKEYVRFGASPRAAQAMVLGGKAMALADSRYNLSGDDVREVAKLALRHRLVLGYEAAADGVAADDIIEELLTAHPAPTVAS
ncbi:MAG: AAA family ATPase [Acidimicrobiia bacterium]|nr:AAA family ATPase [Acidimicrobiia bacterium]